MNQAEFKALSNQIVPKLKENLPDNDVRVLQYETPFSGMLIGISSFKGSVNYEVYEVRNNGDEASWQFKGHMTVQ